MSLKIYLFVIDWDKIYIFNKIFDEGTMSKYNIKTYKFYL